MAKFGIIYATKSKMIRRIIVPESDSTLTDGTHKVGEGETMLVASGEACDLASCIELVKEATGVVPADPRCFVLDKANKIVAVVHADPELDTHPLGTLVKQQDYE